MTQRKSPAFLVAAIDFGTTLSGCAFSTIHEFKKDPLCVKTCDWPLGSRVMTSQKISTCVLFGPEKKFHSFGYEAEDKYSELSLDGEHENWYYFRHFIMMLYDSSGVHRKDMLKDENGNKLPAIVVFSAAIKYLADHLMGTLSRYIDCLSEKDIKWVITVPAFRSDTAKQFTREAAERAGIKEDRLILALEPEAASMLYKYLPVTKLEGVKDKTTCFQPGSKYLVLDAGDYTVDITIHEVQRDGTLKELLKSNGGPWGGTNVDIEFLSFLERIFTFGVLEKFKRECKEDFIDLLRESERQRRSVTPILDSRITFTLPVWLLEIFRNQTKIELRETVRQIPDFGGKITQDKLRVDPDIVKSFYQKTCDEIVRHIQRIFTDRNSKGANTILMVGEFSKSPMLRDAIRRAFPNKRVIYSDEADLAVLKGAVIFGHDQMLYTK